MKLSADLLTPLQPHQQRLIDKLKASGGLLVAHGVGSGKTLSSIAAANALGLPMEAITPAPLQENYEKEMRKHLGERPADARVRSYEKTVRDGDVNPNALVVMDEAHRARNTNTALSEIVARQAAKAQARMLLTGTPVYNQASDLANLLNTAAGRKVLPDDPAMFKKTFVGEKKIEAPFLTRMKGKILGHEVDDVTVPTLLNRDRLVNAAKGYVDVHQGGGEGFPDREDETHEVELSDRQHRMYKFHEGQMPWYLKAKVRAGLPLSKQESTELNAFQGALRQVANTARAYDTSMTDEDERASTPKIQKMVDHLEEMRKKNPNHRAVMYSNFLDSGLKPLQRELVRRGIAHHLFTGEVGKNERDQMVRDYNAGKTPVLLLSGAGSEGLDLKGTRSIQLMEPHWNDSRIDQVIGRGIRYQSHAHLPEAERKTKVMRYFSTLPRSTMDKFEQSILGQKPAQGIEQYLKTTSDYKKNLSDQIRSALQEASDAGPLQRRTYEMPKAAEVDEERKDHRGHVGAAIGGVLGAGAGFGMRRLYNWEHTNGKPRLGPIVALTLANLPGYLPAISADNAGASRATTLRVMDAGNTAAYALGGAALGRAIGRYTTPDEAPKTAADETMERLIASIGDAELRRKGRTDLIHFQHPASLSLDSPYDAEFVRQKLDSDFGGDPQRMGEQLRDDFTNAGYAVLGDVAKKNEARRNTRGAWGAVYGGLAGYPLGYVGGFVGGDKIFNSQFMKRRFSPNARELGLTAFANLAPLPTIALLGSLGRAIGRATYKPFNAEDAVAKHTHPLLMPPKEIKAKTKLEVKGL